MKNKSRTGATVSITILLAVTLLGCTTRSAPDIKGRWKPLNRFAETTEAIPLHHPYMFYPSPTDGTLKTMLSRWAQDSNLVLTYLHPDDFTLHTPVTQIRTSSLQEAMSLLTKIYAEQQISIALSSSAIVVKKSSEPADARRPSSGNATTITK